MIDSRAKGIAFEREVATAFQVVYPGARRGLSQPRSGKETPDVEGTSWWIEAKRGRRPNVPRAIEQAKAASDGRPVLVVSRADRGETLVTLRLTDALPLLAAARGAGPA